MDFTVTLIGAGNMGGAMMRGWLANGLGADKLMVIDPNPSEKIADFLAKSNIQHVTQADDLSPCDVLVIAVKPQMLGNVLPGLKPCFGQQTVAVSVVAGARLDALAEPLDNPATVRAMPNTPSLVGRGMTVACANRKTTWEQRVKVDQLLTAIGRVEWVEDEVLIDAVTAVSGSGPAYVFYLAECLAAAGIKAGLPEDLAMILACETVSGAGELMRQSEDTPETLRKNVTSPGGTTAAALDVLMQYDTMQELFCRAILAAKNRSEELS